MTKIVILGSCRHEPYEILAVPNKIPGLHNTEAGYQKACEKFYPAINKADVVMVYNPDGVGEHTQRDIDYAISQGKLVIYAYKPPEPKGDASSTDPECQGEGSEECQDR